MGIDETTYRKQLKREAQNLSQDIISQILSDADISEKAGDTMSSTMDSSPARTKALIRLLQIACTWPETNEGEERSQNILPEMKEEDHHLISPAQVASTIFWLARDLQKYGYHTVAQSV